MSKQVSPSRSRTVRRSKVRDVSTRSSRAGQRKAVSETSDQPIRIALVSPTSRAVRHLPRAPSQLSSTGVASTRNSTRYPTQLAKREGKTLDIAGNGAFPQDVRALRNGVVGEKLAVGGAAYPAIGLNRRPCDAGFRVQPVKTGDEVVGNDALRAARSEFGDKFVDRGGFAAALMAGYEDAAGPWLPTVPDSESRMDAIPVDRIPIRFRGFAAYSVSRS